MNTSTIVSLDANLHPLPVGTFHSFSYPMPTSRESLISNSTSSDLVAEGTLTIREDALRPYDESATVQLEGRKDISGIDSPRARPSCRRTVHADDIRPLQGTGWESV